MARKYIYGIIPTEQALTFGLSGFPPRPETVYTLGQRGLGCVVSNYGGDDFPSLAKEEQIRCLLAHQAVIEGVMETYPILPVKFGTLVESDAEVQRLLVQGQRTFTQALSRLDGKVEMEVAATWDLKRVLVEIAQEDEIVRLRASLVNRPSAEVLEQQLLAGQLVKASLDRRREEYQRRLLASLQEVALDVQINPLLADELVMNVAFLIVRQREAAFDERVRKLDREFASQLNFRVIGPLPPYSFATVEVIRPSPEKLEEARRLLGLGATVSLAEVKQAYRRLAAQTHPDAQGQGGQGDQAFLRVREAYDLLTAYCQGQKDGGASTEERCFSLAPQEVSQAFLVNIRRATGEAV